MLTDTHAHLDFPEFEGQLDAVIARAREAGVHRIITVGIDRDSFRKSLANAETILGNPFGTTVKVAWYCGGHGVCLDPQNPDQKAILLADTLNWLTQYVKRTGTPADDIPNFQWFDQLGNYYFSDTLPNKPGFNDRPDITATSTGPAASAPSRCGARSMSPYQAYDGISLRFIGRLRWPRYASETG
jgi:hypothetical protein